MHLSIEQQLKSQKLQSNLYQLQAIGLKLERDQAEVRKKAEETEAALVAYIKELMAEFNLSEDEYTFNLDINEFIKKPQPQPTIQ